jgi:hypothetical protein
LILLLGELQEWLEDNDLVAEAVVSREKLRSPRKIIQEEVEELPERKGAEKRKRKEKEEEEAEVLKGSVSPSALREPAKVIGKLAPEVCSSRYSIFFFFFPDLRQVERWLAEESKSPKTVERISSEEREEHPYVLTCSQIVHVTDLDKAFEETCKYFGGMQFPFFFFVSILRVIVIFLSL